MILPAILIHILGRFIPKWIFKSKLNDEVNQFSWKQVLIKMSGSLTSLIVAFIIVTVVTLSSPVKYLLNKNAIYGIECSPLAKEMGFMDGDKIISINDQPIVRFSDILSNIVLGQGNVSVKAQRGAEKVFVQVSDNDKMNFMKSGSYSHFMPKLRPGSSITASAEQLIYTELKQGFTDALESFGFMVKVTYRTIVPTAAKNKKMGGFVSISDVTNLSGYFSLWAVSLIFVSLINLLPIPGLDLGNAVIILIEKVRKKKFNSRLIRIIKIVCISLFVVLMLISIY